MFHLEKTPLRIEGVAEEGGHKFLIEVSHLTNQDGDRGATLLGVLRLKTRVFDRLVSLYTGKCNFYSTYDKTRLADHLKKIDIPGLDSMNWHAFVEALFQEIVTKYMNEGEDAVRPELVENTEVEFLLYPLVPKGYTSLIYAPGGSGKSMVAMMLGILIQNGVTLDFKRVNEPREVMYVDWEMDLREFTRRYSMFVPPWEEQAIPPYYLHCVGTFRDEVYNIIRNIEKYNIEFLIIDSVTAALGAGINDHDVVGDFFQKISEITSMGVTVMLLTHVSKAHKEREDGAMPIGAVTFENRARLTWELKYAIEKEDLTKMHIALFCRKTNIGPLPNVGFTLNFADGLLCIEKIDDTTMEALATDKRLTQKELILSVLQSGDFTAAEIAEATGISKNVVGFWLSTMKKEGLVTNSGKKWSLAKGR